MHAHDFLPISNRRLFLRQTGLGLGGIALGSLLSQHATAAPGILGKPHHEPKAKRIIYLFMAGGPSQLDLYDHKPLLNEKNGTDLPESIRNGQRLTGMSGNQATLPLAGSVFQFNKHGKSGATVSNLLPNIAKMADDLCFVKSC